MLPQTDHLVNIVDISGEMKTFVNFKFIDDFCYLPDNWPQTGVPLSYTENAALMAQYCPLALIVMIIFCK